MVVYPVGSAVQEPICSYLCLSFQMRAFEHTAVPHTQLEYWLEQNKLCLETLPWTPRLQICSWEL